MPACKYFLFLPMLKKKKEKKVLPPAGVSKYAAYIVQKTIHNGHLNTGL
jgi:hypothetical protein